MEILDEYQDGMGQPVAGDVPSAVAGIAGIGHHHHHHHHHHQPDSPMAAEALSSAQPDACHYDSNNQDQSNQTDLADKHKQSAFAQIANNTICRNILESHQEEESDPDRQDEESGEELLQQPLQANNHSSADNTPPSNLIQPAQSQFLAKLKLESEMDMINARNGLEALQAAMSGATFNLPFTFPSPCTFLSPGQQQQHAQHPLGSQLGQTTGGGSSSNGNGNSGNNGSSNSNNNSNNNTSSGGGGGGNNNNGNSGSGAAASSSASSHSGDSSPSGARNGPEASNRSSVGALAEMNMNTNSNGSSLAGQQPTGQQQSSWSFEEQFKQVRQLYEISDDPNRKEFLDDLFSFMQKRGTPINRLPIMAKSVLDLYELYNLVIARGGLVDVINKKLWQEIIKGLHLPSSITSAAFTLRTQYMKYLYPYECEKKSLSTPMELQAAIDGNKREGRRSNYSSYGPGCGAGGGGGGGPGDGLAHQRSPHPTPNALASLHAQISPLSLVTAVQQAAAAGGQHQLSPQNLHNGSAAHTPLPHHPHHPQHQQPGLVQPQNAGMAPEFEARLGEYMKHLTREMNRHSASSPLLSARQGSVSPQPARTGSLDPFLEMSRFGLWGLYNNSMNQSMNYGHPASPQTGSHSPQQQPPDSPEPPQKEALDLGIRSSPSTSSRDPPSPLPTHGNNNVAIKREIEHHSPQPSVSKRLCIDEDVGPEIHEPMQPNTHIRISNRGDGRDNSLVVSMELNGVMYEGVLFAQKESRNTHSLTSHKHDSRTPSRNVVS